MVKKNNQNGQMWIRRTRTKPKQLPNALQGQRAGQMYTSTQKRQRIDVTIEKSCRSLMSIRDKVGFIKKFGEKAFLELPL